MMDKVRVEQQQKRVKDAARQLTKRDIPSPIPGLTSTYVVNTILSFFGYNDDVKDIM